MTMVEKSKHCVLQWAGHAGYITDRFSGLLAHQALVDVTLVCEEQKLRVHKLVLAANSIYFEEILQQDLGQEPIIFLRDLNFDILKAMVEFMYCGETTISQQYLPSLLAAANSFKVKQLACVIDTIMEPEMSENPENNVKSPKDVCVLNTNDVFNQNDHIHKNGKKESKDKCPLLCTGDSNDNSNTNENQSVENNVTNESVEQELEHTLYEESFDSESDIKENSISFLKAEDEINTLSPSVKVNETPNGYSHKSTINDKVYCGDQALKPALYEQCCDLTSVDDYEQNSISVSRSCLQEIDKDFVECHVDNTNVPSKVGKSVKVYTHKRRKSIDEVRNKLVHLKDLVPNSESTDCIDLLEEPSTNDIPVTLLTSLDMESAEYILSLSAENIHKIVGSTICERNASNNCKAITVHSDARNENIATDGDKSMNKKEQHSVDNDHSVKPILRRSMRLNQQENEVSISINVPTGEAAGNRHFKKANSPNRVECARGKRRAKEMDRKVPDQNAIGTMQSSKKNCTNSRTTKSTSKLIVKRNNKCTVTGREKEVQKIKLSNKVKCDIPEKIEISDISFLTSTKLSTIRYINRSLWGDMSDILEDDENQMDVTEYTPNTEIPFAVGLLPLRTALEKMQATPDYQPRKTRSSVTPMKQEINNLKRKNYAPIDSSILSKRQNTNNNGHHNENAKTVCHIQIRAAPSQYVRNRKKFLSQHIALESAAVITRQ